jgi:hypothetical protein
MVEKISCLLFIFKHSHSVLTFSLRCVTLACLFLECRNHASISHSVSLIVAASLLVQRHRQSAVPSLIISTPVHNKPYSSDSVTTSSDPSPSPYRLCLRHGRAPTRLRCIIGRRSYLRQARSTCCEGNNIHSTSLAVTDVKLETYQ